MSLAVATRGYFCEDVPVSIATRGYFCDIVVPTVDKNIGGGDQASYELPSTLQEQRLREDEELLVLISAFMETLD